MAVCGIGTSAHAQTPAAKPLRLVVGFAPGGSTDVVARLLARKLSDHSGASIVVENRAGASSNIAAQTVARAAPDGLTLLYLTSTLAVNVSLFQNLPFDPLKDFAFVAPVVDIPAILAVHGALPVKSVKELITLAKARPGELTYASAGSGSASHMATELFKSLTSVTIVHVPYKGAGPAMTDFLGGHVQIQFLYNAEQVKANAKTGRLRALGVSAKKRLAELPALPTMQEAGLANFEAGVWNGVAAPAGTSRDAIARWNTLINAATKDLTPTLAELGGYPMRGTPEEFTEFFRREVAKWAKVVKAAGVKAE